MKISPPKIFQLLGGLLINTFINLWPANGNIGELQQSSCELALRVASLQNQILNFCQVTRLKGLLNKNKLFFKYSNKAMQLLSGLNLVTTKEGLDECKYQFATLRAEFSSLEANLENTDDVAPWVERLLTRASP